MYPILYIVHNYNFPRLRSSVLFLCTADLTYNFFSIVNTHIPTIFQIKSIVNFYEYNLLVKPIQIYILYYTIMFFHFHTNCIMV